MNNFHKEPKVKIKEAVTKLSRRLLCSSAGTEHGAKYRSSPLQGLEPACNLGLSRNTCGRRIKNKPQANRKRQSLVGRKKGNGSCNSSKDFSQCSTKLRWKMKVLYYWSFKIISVDSLQLLRAVRMLISPIFASSFFKRSSSGFMETGHMAQHFDKQVPCCLQWESTSRETFGRAR